MVRSFAITTPATESLRPDAKGHVEVVFTVTNTTPRPIRGMAKVKALGDTKREWLGIEGEPERDIAAGTTAPFTVTFDVPVTASPKGDTARPGDTKVAAGSAGTGTTGGAPAKKYPFRLDVSSAVLPEEDFTEGPTVTVEVAEKPVIIKDGGFKWWIILVILGVVLLVGGLVLFLVLRNGGEGPKKNGTPQASPTPSPSPKPAGTFQGRWVNVDPNTGGITRLQIRQNGTQLIVHAFGKCHPTDCDWGEEKGSVIANSGNVTWDQGFALVKMVITSQGQDQLKVVTDTVFNDNRKRMHEEYVFKKES
jgi:hypothetical protein